MYSDVPDGQQPPQPVPLTMPATVAQCHVVIQALALEVGQLREQTAWLQERLKVDSRNSSKPPSSDGPSSGNRAQRRASGRKRGAQEGHPGAYRDLLPQAEVDGVHDCTPAALCACGGAVNVQGKPVRHQVFDIPPVAPVVQEYRLYSGVCAQCGLGHRAALPPGVPSGQIGARALALVGVLGTRFHLTQGKIRDLLAQMLGLDFSVGAISQAHGKVAAALAAPVAAAAASLGCGGVVHGRDALPARRIGQLGLGCDSAQAGGLHHPALAGALRDHRLDRPGAAGRGGLGPLCRLCAHRCRPAPGVLGRVGTHNRPEDGLRLTRG